MELKIKISKKAQRQMEWLKEELNLKNNQELFQSSLSLIYYLTKKLSIGKETTIVRKK